MDTSATETESSFFLKIKLSKVWLSSAMLSVKRFFTLCSPHNHVVLWRLKLPEQIKPVVRVAQCAVSDSSQLWDNLLSTMVSSCSLIIRMAEPWSFYIPSRTVVNYYNWIVLFSVNVLFSPSGFWQGGGMLSRVGLKDWNVMLVNLSMVLIRTGQIWYRVIPTLRADTSLNLEWQSINRKKSGLCQGPTGTEIEDLLTLREKIGISAVCLRWLWFLAEAYVYFPTWWVCGTENTITASAWIPPCGTEELF